MGCEGGEAGCDEDEARGRGFDQERGEFSRDYVSSGDVDVVGLVEDGTNVGNVVCKVDGVKSRAYSASISCQSHIIQ